MSYYGVSFEQQIDYLTDLGLRSYRVNISRADQADELGRLVALAKPRGIEILPVITPDLPIDTGTPDALYRGAFDLAVSLVSRFKNDIRVWELGNEMENHAIIQPCEMKDDGTQYNCSWGPAGGMSPLDYYTPRWAKVSAVMKGLSDGTISVDPTIRKAMGTAGWGHTGAFERMQKDGIRWDISVWHMYGEDPKWAFDVLAGYGKPIWVTELNHPYGSQKGEDAQADGMVRWMSRLRELAPTYKIEAAHLYELMDESYFLPDFEAVMGLVRLEGDERGGWRPGSPKPAYFAVRDFVRPEAKPAATSAAKPGEPFRYALDRSRCSLEGAERRDAPAHERVEYAYCLVLGRKPGPDELAAWRRDVASGNRTLPELVTTLLDSPEFVRGNERNLASSTAFVSATYEILLGRQADGAGLESFVKALHEGSLSRVRFQRDVVASSEFKERHPVLVQDYSMALKGADAAAGRWRRCQLNAFDNVAGTPGERVAYAYCLVLGRLPDGYGLRSYVESGRPVPEIALGFVASEEFNRKLDEASLGDAATVALFYRLFLDRAPDGDGLEKFTARLNRGALSRAELARELMESDEFKKRRPLIFASR